MKDVNRKKISMVLFLCLAIALVMTACMSKTGTDENPMTTPGASAAPSVSPQATVEAQGAFDWLVNGEKVEENLSKISEISEARVIVNGDTALVAVKFNPAYKGEMTERIREMVAAEVMAADPRITTVAVTAYEDDVDDVYELADKMALGRDVNELKEEVSEIVRNATTLR